MTGITKTKDMFKQLTEENNDWEYKIKYDTTPFFIIESFSNNSSNDNHEKLVTNLNNLSKEYKLFTKVEYIGKKQES
jgi:mannitol/fructose-specific phosphotransferase system IIA component (Ntr-type)